MNIRLGSPGLDDMVIHGYVDALAGELAAVVSDVHPGAELGEVVLRLITQARRR